MGNSNIRGVRGNQRNLKEIKVRFDGLGFSVLGFGHQEIREGTSGLESVIRIILETRSKV